MRGSFSHSACSTTTIRSGRRRESGNDSSAGEWRNRKHHRFNHRRIMNEKTQSRKIRWCRRTIAVRWWGGDAVLSGYVHTTTVLFLLSWKYIVCILCRVCSAPTYTQKLVFQKEVFQWTILGSSSDQFLKEPFLSWFEEHLNNLKYCFHYKEPFINWKVSMDDSSSWNFGCQ